MQNNPTRANDQLRNIEFIPHFTQNALGSCLCKMGNTWVLCTASFENKVPSFLEKSGQGWLTAEYSMLPASTHSRSRREVKSGKQSGRSQEIQRLIGRSLRACIDLNVLGEKSITIDCDVLQADGGTRIASINGAYVALNLAIAKLLKEGRIQANPVKHQVAGVSIGIKDNTLYTDLDYALDSTCDVDMNIVYLSTGSLVEIQGTAERATFTQDQSIDMMKAAWTASEHIFKEQVKALG